MTYFPEAYPIYKTEKTITFGTGASTYIYQCFAIKGLFEIVGLYGVVTDATNMTTFSDCAWDVGVSTDVGGGTWLTLGDSGGVTGVDLSGFVVGSWVGKVAAATDLAEALTGGAFGINEKDYYSTIVAVKGGEPTANIGFQVTEDVNTDAQINMVCLWRSLSTGSYVNPGSGTVRSGA